MSDLSRFDAVVEATREHVSGTTYYDGRPPTVPDALVAYADEVARLQRDVRIAALARTWGAAERGPVMDADFESVADAALDDLLDALDDEIPEGAA